MVVGFSGLYGLIRAYRLTRVYMGLYGFCYGFRVQGFKNRAVGLQGL